MLDQKTQNLRNAVRELGRVAVAFSGGIDSTLIAKIAAEELGGNAVALTATSASMPRSELAECQSLAKEIGITHVLLESHELENASYQKNDKYRCYFCKTEVYQVFTDYAREHGIAFILDGTNADDTGDHRPGTEAAREKGVRSLLQQTGFTKADIRDLARQLGLPNWNKPAAACLSSRIPYGSPVTLLALSQVEQAEEALKEMGLSQLRVRHHDQVARIEVPAEEFEAVLANREALVSKLKALGYNYITLDLAGFRSGSMNEVLTDGHQPVTRATV